MKRGLVLGLFFMLLMGIGFSSAGFEIGNLSHKLTKTSYGPEELIKGWINISLDNEEASSQFTDLQNNKITLINLLRNNTDLIEGNDYTCNPSDCESDYTSSDSGSSTKNFSLNSGESKIIGLKFTGKEISITSINFTIESTANTSCTNQLKIDFLNDGATNLGNTNASLGVCALEEGCFNSQKSSTEIGIGFIGGKKHCQKIKLGEAPGFELGAWIKRNGDTRNITMELLDKFQIQRATCILPTTPDSERVFCQVDYLVTKPEDHYICVYTETLSNNIKIKGYSDNENGCGSFDFNVNDNELDSAFDIIVKPRKFGNFGVLEVSDSLSDGSTLGALAHDYLVGKYGGGSEINCDINSCYVPIKITSNTAQTVDLSNLVIDYTSSLGKPTNTKFYDLVETPSKISADFQKISLDNSGLRVKDSYGNFTFKLKLDGNEIFSEKVTVQRVPTISRLIPTTAPAAVPTPFTVEVSSSRNISTYKWDFGDNKTSTTTKNKTTHTYKAVGSYNLKVTVIDSSNINSSKTFNITVRPPQEEINKSLKKKLGDLNNIKEQIKKLDLFTQERLNSILETNIVEDSLKEIQKNFTQASSEEDFTKIMAELVDLDVPESIMVSASIDSSNFYVEEDSINLDVLSRITGENYTRSAASDYKESILSWNQQKFNTKITFEEISAKYGSEEKPILRVFELVIGENATPASSPFLILNKLTNLEFKQNYNEKNISDYIYIELDSFPKTLVFSTTEDVDFIDLPIFISPKISELSVEFKEIGEEKKTSKWVIFTLIISLLIVGGFITYIVLQEWYRKKYEEHLFKNRNNLFNLITYIENTKRKGLNNKEIVSKLRKAGWNSEQIRYAMRKHAGKRTGMVELPFRIGKKKQEHRMSPKESFPKRQIRRKPHKRF